MNDSGSSRRDFMKKAAYTAPLIMTMNVSLAQARSGSGITVDRPKKGGDRPWLGKNDGRPYKRPVRGPLRWVFQWLFG